MMYRFKCKATGDVLMAGPVGDRLLGILGKPVMAQGILQTADMLADIQGLERAVAEDEARLSDLKDKLPVGYEPKAGEAVTLRQHAWPLIDMLKQAQAAQEVIVWGV